MERITFKKGNIVRCINIESVQHKVYKPTLGNYYKVINIIPAFNTCISVKNLNTPNKDELMFKNTDLYYDAKCFVLETCEVVKALYEKSN